MSDSQPPSAPAQRAISPIRLAVTIAVVVGIAAAVYFIQLNRIEGVDKGKQDEKARRAMGIGEPVKNRLGSAYQDKDNDLVADTPAGSADQINPEVITFSFIATGDPEASAAVWAPLVAHLEQATGKTVQYVPYTSRDEQLRAIREGRLHIAGLNTGAVPIAVNACGFVPICAPGMGDQAQSYKMVVIVPKGSTTKKLEDVRGQTFAVTQFTSNSGFKAAVLALDEVAGLKLEQDYQVAFTHGHAQLIQDIADKKYVAGSTASDLLKNDPNAGAVEVIYESEPFPTAALGVTHRLAPDLARQVREALLGFSFAGTPLATEYAASGADRLVPISYKDDFALIRRIDDAVGYDHERELSQEKQGEGEPTANQP